MMYTWEREHISTEEQKMKLDLESHRAEYGPEPGSAVVNTDGFQKKSHAKSKKDTNSICGDVCVSDL